MRIAYLLGSLNRGGTETLLLDVFNSAVNTPFKMIGVYRKEGILSDGFHSSEVSLFKLTPGPLWMLWLYMWRLRKLLLREKVDIVHAQQNLDAVYAGLACLGLRIKVVQTFHGYDFHLGHFNKLLIRLSLKMAYVNIFVSESQRKHYAQTYKLNQNTKQVVVYNGINFSKLKLRSENAIPSDSKESKIIFSLAMVGNFVPVRDQMTVCRFLDLLNRKGINFNFSFIGRKDEKNPQLYDECESFCLANDLKDKVLFCGTRPDVPSLLHQLDAFIYSTDHDTFGLAVIEAIATGIPVFVNDWQVMKEITDSGKRASLYHTKDENDLFDKFMSFVEQPKLFAKAALENAAWARKTYSIQNHVERLYEVYHETE